MLNKLRKLKRFLKRLKISLLQKRQEILKKNRFNKTRQEENGSKTLNVF